MLKEDFVFGFFVGAIFIFLSGIIIADDDITADALKVASKVCGGWENISYIDTDGIDTVVCMNGKEFIIANEERFRGFLKNEDD